MVPLLFSIVEVLIVLVPVLFSVAFMTIIERKVLASMQRRVGPNVVGYYGIMQPCERHFLVKENLKTELYAVKYFIC